MPFSGKALTHREPHEEWVSLVHYHILAPATWHTIGTQQIVEWMGSVFLVRLKEGIRSKNTQWSAFVKVLNFIMQRGWVLSY